VSILCKSGFAKTKIGTPYYICPEIYKGQFYRYSADIWSLGCIVYELCCLKRPFEAHNILALSRAICYGKYNSIPYRYSDDINMIIKRMLSTSSKSRPSTKAILSIVNSSYTPIRKKAKLLNTIMLPKLNRVKLDNIVLPESNYNTSKSNINFLNKEDKRRDYFKKPIKNNSIVELRKIQSRKRLISQRSKSEPKKLPKINPLYHSPYASRPKFFVKAKSSIVQKNRSRIKNNIYHPLYNKKWLR